jgi:hypothetical protein
MLAVYRWPFEGEDYFFLVQRREDVVVAWWNSEEVRCVPLEDSRWLGKGLDGVVCVS